MVSTAVPRSRAVTSPRSVSQRSKRPMTSPSGEETIPILSQQIRGTWVHELQYDLRVKGKHKVEVLLDDVTLPGCPMEFAVKTRLVP